MGPWCSGALYMVCSLWASPASAERRGGTPDGSIALARSTDSWGPLVCRRVSSRSSASSSVSSSWNWLSALLSTTTVGLSACAHAQVKMPVRSRDVSPRVRITDGCHEHWNVSTKWDVSTKKNGALMEAQLVPSTRVDLT